MNISCKMLIMISIRPATSEVSDQQHGHLDLFVQGLVHFLDVAGTLQDITARELKLQPIHLAFLRRANINGKGSVTFDRIRADTKLPRYAVSRAAAHLERQKLGSVRDLKRDNRYRRFVINDRGRAAVDHIDLGIAKELLRKIQVGRFDSKRFYLFTAHLYNLTRFLPDSRVTTEYRPTDIHFGKTVDPDDPVTKLIELPIAADRRFPMSSG